MTLGARTGTWSTSINALTVKSYVQDGLIIQFDGIENVDYGTNDRSVQRWKDLKKNAHDLIPDAAFGWSDYGVNFIAHTPLTFTSDNFNQLFPQPRSVSDYKEKCFQIVISVSDAINDSGYGMSDLQ